MKMTITGGDTSLLAKLSENVDKAVKETVKRLANYGADEAQRGFDNSLHTGSMDITVSATHGNGKSEINAEGEQVAFVEFGTGVMYANHPLGEQLGMVHGTYGQKKGSNPKGWAYVGEQGNWGSPVYRRNKDGTVSEVPGVYRTRGQPASRSMFNAAEAMKTQAQTIFEQEIKKIK